MLHPREKGRERAREAPRKGCHSPEEGVEDPKRQKEDILSLELDVDPQNPMWVSEPDVGPQVQCPCGSEI